MRMSTTVKGAAIAVVIASTALGAQQAPPASAEATAGKPAGEERRQGVPADRAACTISGRITGAGGPLPGVSITVSRDATVQKAASTDVDGTFKLTLPDASYQLIAELTGFDKAQKDVTVSRDVCAQTVDLAMTLTPRTASAAPPTGRGAGAAGQRAGRTPAAANETAEAAAQRRFESLTVTENEQTRSLDPGTFESDGVDASAVIAAGFGSEALADAFAVTGEATRVDNGLLNQRRDAINRGEFLPPDFDPRNVQGNFAGLEAALQGRGGRQGGNPNLQGRGGGGPDGRGGGRGANPNFRGGQRIQGNASYTFSGSALNSAPRQLRSEVSGVEPRNANHNYNFTSQIPVKIPGIYSNTNNRTMLRVTYSGGTGTNPFDQYATVPTDAMRRGDFSSVSTPLIDPLTGQPFAGNQIPADRLSPQALALLEFYPAATLPGTTRNYHRATTNYSRQNQVQLQLQHNFSAQQAGRGGRGGGPQGNAGRAGGQGNAGRGGQQGRGAVRTNVNMTLNFNYNQSDDDQLNVFSTLGGARESRNYSLSNNFNIQRARNQFRLSANYNHSSSGSINNFSGVANVADAIGIRGVSDSPFAWGLPRLSFSSITGLSDVNPSRSIGDRVGTNVTWSRPFGRHQIQTGGVLDRKSVV